MSTPHDTLFSELLRQVVDGIGRAKEAGASPSELWLGLTARSILEAEVSAQVARGHFVREDAHLHAGVEYMEFMGLTVRKSESEGVRVV